MRETDYVELAFWSGWAEALGHGLSPEELIGMNAALRDQVAEMVQDYLEDMAQEESHATS